MSWVLKEVYAGWVEFEHSDYNIRAEVYNSPNGQWNSVDIHNYDLKTSISLEVEYLSDANKILKILDNTPKWEENPWVALLFIASRMSRGWQRKHYITNEIIENYEHFNGDWEEAIRNTDKISTGTGVYRWLPSYLCPLGDIVVEILKGFRYSIYKRDITNVEMTMLKNFRKFVEPVDEARQELDKIMQYIIRKML